LQSKGQAEKRSQGKAEGIAMTHKHRNGRLSKAAAILLIIALAAGAFTPAGLGAWGGA
jgi:hypothetical protein